MCASRSRRAPCPAAPFCPRAALTRHMKMVPARRSVGVGRGSVGALGIAVEGVFGGQRPILCDRAPQQPPGAHLLHKSGLGAVLTRQPARKPGREPRLAHHFCVCVAREAGLDNFARQTIVLIKLDRVIRASYHGLRCLVSVVGCCRRGKALTPAWLQWRGAQTPKVAHWAQFDAQIPFEGAREALSSHARAHD